MIGLITRVAGEIAGQYQARKLAKVTGAVRIEEKRIDVELARLEADAARYARDASSDADYDLQVLRNRDRSWSDEFLIVIFVLLFILPFLDAIQASWSGERFGLAEAVAEGWRAHGYDGAPWWFEFLMVGIAVSTLGLSRLFRLWAGRPARKKEETP